MARFFDDRLDFDVSKESVESVIKGIGPRSGCKRTKDKYDWIRKPRSMEEASACSTQDASALSRQVDDLLIRVAAIEGREEGASKDASTAASRLNGLSARLNDIGKRGVDSEELLKQLLSRCDALEKVTVKLQQQLFEHITIQHGQQKQTELNFFERDKS